MPVFENAPGATDALCLEARLTRLVRLEEPAAERSMLAALQDGALPRILDQGLFNRR